MIRAGLFHLFDTLGQKHPADFYQEALEECVAGEAMGFDAACPAEHHFSENYGIMPRTELFLAMVAARTTRMKLWPMLSVATLADPVRLAEDMSLLDNFSKGRLVCSIGTGYRPYEFERFNQDIAENGERIREEAEILRRLFREDSVTYDGKFYQVNDVHLAPRPYQKPAPPMYITTTRSDQIEWAARNGIGVVPAAGFNVATLKHDYDLHARTAEAAGQPQMPYRPFFKWIYVHEDHETGVNEGYNYILQTLMAFAQGGGKLFSMLMGKTVDTWGTELHKPDWFSNKWEDIVASGAGYPELLESGWTPFVCGGPEHVAEVLRPFVEAGGNYFMGGFKCGPMPHEKVLNSMQLFADEVVPRLGGWRMDEAA